MNTVGQKERETQDRVIKLFQNRLRYTYLGNWIDRENNRNIKQKYLSQWLRRKLYPGNTGNGGIYVCPAS